MEYIHTDKAPAAIGPYSQAVKIGNVVYTSGQVALDPKTGMIVPGGFDAQARRVLENLDAVITAGGGKRSDVAKATVYVTDLANFDALNKLYEEFFGKHKPARTTVQVPALPKGSLLEIDFLLYLG
jgi:2-iminobutanoate/2-iminopropanoate deaminase